MWRASTKRVKVGAGECLTKVPEGGSGGVATGQRDRDLQTMNRSLPVENGYDNQVDTKFTAAENHQKIKGLDGKPQGKGTKRYNRTTIKKRNIQHKTQVLGYVPIQITNLSPEVELEPKTYVGVASPIGIIETQECKKCNVNIINREVNTKQDGFDKYLG